MSACDCQRAFQTGDDAMTDPAANPSTPTQSSPAQNMGAALGDIAEAWISQGLAIAKLALDTSARTLTRTASMLEALRTAFVHRREGTGDGA
jgi:hypothetical protein